MTTVDYYYYFLKDALRCLAELATTTGKWRDGLAVFEIFWSALRLTRFNGLKNLRKVSS